MKVVFTVNVCTNDGLANGAEESSGKLSMTDYPSSRGKAVVLKRPPKYAVVELIGRIPGAYEGLQPRHVPVYPDKAACVHTIWRRDGTKIQHNFQRIQLLVTPAFAFTDYKCQGRTLPKVIADLLKASPARGCM